MNRVFMKKLIMVMIACVASIVMVLIVSQPSDAENTKKKDGLNFHVPEDWPIEKRNGILGPIPTEEYILIKLTEVGEEFQAVKADLASKFEELQSDVKNVKAEFTKEIQNVQSQADSGAEVEGDLKNILESLDFLKIEIERLDREIKKKVATLNMKNQETATTVTFMEKTVKGLQTQVYRLDEEVDYILDAQEGSY